MLQQRSKLKMAYAIYQDMKEIYNNPDKWVNHGRYALENKCRHKEGVSYSGYCEKCDISEDSAIPIMNYIYPLELTDFDEAKILKVVRETNCTVLENSDSGEWYLAMCGGGMDLSQDIALAYIILEKWIPKDLLGNVCSSPCLSLGSKNWKILAKGVISQSRSEARDAEDRAKRWGDSLGVHLKTKRDEAKAKKSTEVQE